MTFKSKTWKKEYAYNSVISRLENEISYLLKEKNKSHKKFFIKIINTKISQKKKTLEKFRLRKLKGGSVEE